MRENRLSGLMRGGKHSGRAAAYSTLRCYPPTLHHIWGGQKLTFLAMNRRSNMLPNNLGTSLHMNTHALTLALTIGVIDQKINITI